jgi:hypothetical protein
MAGLLESASSRRRCGVFLALLFSPRVSEATHSLASDAAKERAFGTAGVAAVIRAPAVVPEQATSVGRSGWPRTELP